MPYMTPIDAYRQAETFKAEQQQNALANLMNQAKLRQAAQQEQDQAMLRDMLMKASAEPNMDYGSLGRKMLAINPDTGFSLIKMDEGQRAQEAASKRLAMLGGGQGMKPSNEGGQQPAGGGVFESWMQHQNPGIKAMAKQGSLLAQSGGFKDVADLNAYVQKMGEFDARFNDAQSSRQERMQVQRDLAQMNFDLRKSLAQEQMNLRRDLSQQGKWSYDAERGLAINTATGEARQIIQDGNPIGAKVKGSGAATEDERKAAGWFAQADNAYRNMSRVIKESPGAKSPGAIEAALSGAGLEGAAQSVRGEGRQQFVQAASSFAEATLRAATGAGVNRDEARQKVVELTPQYWDDDVTKKQKIDSMMVYLGSLKMRAGRALPSDTQLPTAIGGQGQSAGGRITPAPKTFNAPPDPRQYDGRTITDPDTGTKLLSRGGQWVRVK